MLTDQQIERWRLLAEERQADQADLQRHAERDRRRRAVVAEMVPFLQSFLDEDISLEEFRATFDSKTRTQWDVFGMKGASGAMFLNTLVKHIPNQEEVAQQLRMVLPEPSEPRLEQGRRKTQEFHDYLQKLIDTGQVARRQVQPSRVSFFVSGWWHVQDPEFWPPYYISARRAFEKEGAWTMQSDPVEAYFDFRTVFQELAHALELSSWETEHLLAWYDEGGGHQTPASPTVDGSAPRFTSRAEAALEPAPGDDAPPQTPADGEDDVSGSSDEQLSHSHIQWLLARIGRRLGCRVWIAANDHSHTHNQQRLGDLSIDQLPNFSIDNDFQRIVSLIDVIWLQNRNRIAAAFEVESTTSVYSGILRMADLVALAPNLSFPLYIVAPERRIAKVERELRRPTFQVLGLHEQCSYFTFEELDSKADQIMQWASDPNAIKRLARTVDSQPSW